MDHKAPVAWQLELYFPP